ncbi:c-type cytochrome [Thermoflexibacter ruber]|uniref:Cytochrome c, mono-and diheme variants n=1 Tax=Thermoflexibacter ruber TaxID=1003 RepID=A0A1I2E5Z3_9BACT|nr:cytochrome c [Thermoflexibacter ruber]SFE87918.1 Cytochrome c, mono-and diheme variants [Thermoflexibacter ruber]
MRQACYLKFFFFILLIALLFTSCQDAETVKLQVYISEGQRLYEQKCANCHQRDGTGLRKLIPPLAGADYLIKYKNSLACIVKYGLTGEIEVNGQKYNLSMPANEGLSDRHIAQILTYINSKWAGSQERVKDEEVKERLRQCQ